MKNLWLIIFLLTFNTLLTAQEIDHLNNSFKIDILAPGISGEFPIAKNQTIAGSLNLTFALLIRGSSYSKTEVFYGLPSTLYAEYRFYYNRPKRVSKGKTIYNNSGAYFAPHFRYIGPEIAGNYPFGSLYSNQTQLGVVIGIQKTFASNLQLGFSVGPGINLNDEDTSAIPVGNLNFSYVISPKKNK